MPWDAPGSTAIVVLAQEAEPVVGEWYAANSRAGAEGMIPHITLLVPFVPARLLDELVERRLLNVFSAAAPFDYTLPGFERFAEGVLYLAPEPPEPFIDLVQSLSAEFPDYPPNDGIYDEVIPHLTVAQTEDERLVETITAAVQPQLPLLARATEATLFVRDNDLRWRRRAQYPLGG